MDPVPSGHYDFNTADPACSADVLVKVRAQLLPHEFGKYLHKIHSVSRGLGRLFSQVQAPMRWIITISMPFSRPLEFRESVLEFKILPELAS